MSRLICVLVTLLLAIGTPGFPAAAHEQHVGDLVLHHAWSRATPAGAKTGAVFLAIENTGDTADQLVSVSSDAAAMTMVHEMSMANDIMSMKPAGALEIPPHATLALKPHGIHIMLMGLKQGLAEGDTFVVTLEFARAGKVNLQVVVEKVNAMESLD